MITDFSSVTSYIAAAVMLALVVGYTRALIADWHGLVFHLVFSICLVFFTYVLRTLYWDNLHPYLPEDFLDRETANVVFDGLAIWGGIHGHIAIYLMIPSADRAKWSVFTAWLYPPVAICRAVKKVFSWLFLNRRS